MADCPRSPAAGEDVMIAVGAVCDEDDSPVCSGTAGEAFTTMDTATGGRGGKRTVSPEARGVEQLYFFPPKNGPKQCFTKCLAEIPPLNVEMTRADGGGEVRPGLPICATWRKSSRTRHAQIPRSLTWGRTCDKYQDRGS